MVQITDIEKLTAAIMLPRTAPLLKGILECFFSGLIHLTPENVTHLATAKGTFR